MSSSSGQYIRIETIGRKTGKPRQVIVRFVAFPDRVVVFPMHEENITQQWVHNIASNPKIKLFMDNKVWEGSGSIKRISGLEDPLLSIFTRKYGRETVLRWYKGQHNYVEIVLDQKSLGAISTDELIYGDLEAAFDGVAANYDHHIFGNKINTWLRNVSVKLLTSTFKKSDRVLEIGCGTGTETIALAKSGINVVACDVSSQMLAVLDKKAAEAGVSKNIVTVHAKPSQDLEQSIREKIGRVSLDGAYSTYGAINTEPDLSAMFRSMNSIMKEDSPLVLGVWNKYCLFEMVGYSLKFMPSLAFARLRNPVPVGKSRFCVASNAYSVRSLQPFLDPFFKLKKVYGVVITLPPSNLVKYLPRGGLLNTVEGFDYRLGNVFPFNRLGDHFLAVYQTK